MTSVSYPSRLSTKRAVLCSRTNAQRVAGRVFDNVGGRVSVVRTGNPIQPFCVTPGEVASGVVELEMLSA